MSVQADRLDEAYVRVRAHLHERPYDADPSLLYRDLGSLSQLLGALDYLGGQMRAAAIMASGADDRLYVERIAQINEHLDALSDRLHQAAQEVDLAHGHVSHLVFALDPELAS